MDLDIKQLAHQIVVARRRKRPPPPLLPGSAAPRKFVPLKLAPPRVSNEIQKDLAANFERASQPKSPQVQVQIRKRAKPKPPTGFRKPSPPSIQLLPRPIENKESERQKIQIPPLLLEKSNAEVASAKKTLKIEVEEDEDPVQKYHGVSISRVGDEEINFGSFQVREHGIRREDGAELHLRGDLIMMDPLGQGAGGTVYKAIHKPSLKLVAVKTIPVFDPTKRSQMLKELKALYENIAPIESSLSGSASCDDKVPCPFVVTFHDAFINSEMANVAMIIEYMDGGSLQDIVEMGGCSNEPILSQIAVRILHGLKFIHDRNHIHRDIKPSNLLINHKGEVKISDFGIIRELESTQAMASTFVGTMTYMSPERIRGNSYGPNSDIWSFGLSLMTVALGSFPLTTSGGYWALLSSLNDDPVPRLPEDKFSPMLIDFMDQCLQKDPPARPSTNELLQHPFILQSEAIVQAQLQGAEKIHSDHLEDAHVELNELARIFIKSTQPTNLHPFSSQFKNVAHQLGVDLDTVSNTFLEKLLQFNEQ